MLLLLFSGGCGNDETYQDESAVKVAITSEPAAVAGTELLLTADITGLTQHTESNSKIDFDIREETEQELPVLITSTKAAAGKYQVKVTFDKPGKYWIYIHIYSGDEVHIIKKTSIPGGLRLKLM